MRVVYVTSSSRGSGKTTVIAGLAGHLAGQSIGYFKPRLDGGEGLDPDAESLKVLLKLPEPPEVLAPAFPDPASFLQAARRACVTAAAGKDVVLVEGPLLPGAAETLDARVIGVEPYSENAAKLAAAYQSFNDRPIGIVINRVPARRLANAGPELAGQIGRLRLLGAIPEDRALLGLTVGELAATLNGKVWNGTKVADRLVESYMLGAATPDPGPLYFGLRTNKAVILKSERPDMQIAALQTATACLVLAGKTPPSQVVLGLAEDRGVPVIAVEDDVMTITRRLESALANSRFSAAKVSRVNQVLSGRLDFDAIEQALG